MNEGARAGDDDQGGPLSPLETGPGPDTKAFFADPPGWPKVIGWIGAGWGVFGLGCLGCGVLGAMMPAIFPQGMEQQFPDGFPDVIASPPMSSWVMWAISGVVSLVQITAAATLIMRKPIARQLHIVYAALGIASGALALWLGVQQQQAITDWVNQNPGTKFSQQQTASGTFNTIILIVFVVIGFAWPVFCALWFGLIKRDASEINRGVQQVV